MSHPGKPTRRGKRSGSAQQIRKQIKQAFDGLKSEIVDGHFVSDESATFNPISDIAIGTQAEGAQIIDLFCGEGGQTDFVDACSAAGVNPDEAVVRNTFAGQVEDQKRELERAPGTRPTSDLLVNIDLHEFQEGPKNYVAVTRKDTTERIVVSAEPGTGRTSKIFQAIERLSDPHAPPIYTTAARNAIAARLNFRTLSDAEIEELSGFPIQHEPIFGLTRPKSLTPNPMDSKPEVAAAYADLRFDVPECAMNSSARRHPPRPFVAHPKPTPLDTPLGRVDRAKPIKEFIDRKTQERKDAHDTGRSWVYKPLVGSLVRYEQNTPELGDRPVGIIRTPPETDTLHLDISYVAFPTPDGQSIVLAWVPTQSLSSADEIDVATLYHAGAKDQPS